MMNFRYYNVVIVSENFENTIIIILIVKTLSE